jgi:hypothetical protein
VKYSDDLRCAHLRGGWRMLSVAMFEKWDLEIRRLQLKARVEVCKKM